MGDAVKNDSAPAPSFGSPSESEKDGRSWLPMAIGGALVIAAVAAVVIFTHYSRSNAKGPNPYIARLQLSGLNMATAQNFAGGTVTYIQGKITNTGDRRVIGATAEVVFKNSLGEVSQWEKSLPIMVLLPNLPYVDYGPMEHASLAPGQTRDFRLTLEHVTADWDGQIPQVKVVSVSTN